MSDAKNLETANFVMGVIFDHLLTNFPMRQPIDLKELSEKLQDVLEVAEEYDASEEQPRHIGHQYIANTKTNPRTYLAEISDWLTHEGFLTRERTTHGRDRFRLTLQALDILGSRPAELDETLGDRLTKAVKTSGSEAGKSAIGEVVGLIIASAAKGFAAP